MKIAWDDRGERPCRQASLTFPVPTRGFLPIRADPWEDLDAAEDLIRIVDAPRGRSGAGTRVEFRIRKFDGAEGEIRAIALDDLFALVTRQPHQITWSIAVGSVTLTEALPADDVIWRVPLSDPFDFGDGLTFHAYGFRSLLASARNPAMHSTILTRVDLAPSFTRVLPPPGQNDSGHYLDYLASDLALGGPLPGSTIDFSREDGDGVHYTFMGGTITALELVTPEPSSLVLGLTAAGVLAGWWWRRTRKPAAWLPAAAPAGGPPG